MVDIKDKFKKDSWTLIYSGQCITPLSYKAVLQHLDYLSEEINNKNCARRVALIIRSVPTFKSDYGYTESFITPYEVKFPSNNTGYIIKPLDSESIIY